MGIRLMDVADAVDMGDECHSYYDRQTDALVLVFADELSAAEELPDDADLEEAARFTASGQVESIELALLIVGDLAGRFVPLPTRWDVHEHSIMKRFTTTLPESRLRERLWDGLHRSGAFRRFKDLVHRYDLADA